MCKYCDDEMMCIIIGCRNCRHFDGIVYYEEDIPKGVALGMEELKKRHSKYINKEE